MKKFFFLAGAVMTALAINADTTLFEAAEGRTISWDNTLTIEAASFATAVEGNMIKLTFVEDGAKDVVEFKANGRKLAGSRYTGLSDWMTTHEYFMTQDAVDSIKAYGMEICGGGFTINKVELCDGKAGNMKEGHSLWTGYFWVDSWSTLEVFKEAFEAVDLTQYAAIRFYSECPNTDNLIFLLSKWGDDGVVAKSEPATDSISIADGNALWRYEGYAELDLSKVNPLTLINGVSSDRLMIQMDKQGNAAFNFTDVVLVTELTEKHDGQQSQAIVNAATDAKASKAIVGHELVIVKNGVRYNVLGARL